MKPKFFSIFRHSMIMVGRTIKNYAMLSMTVVLSFSILLCYLLFNDSNLYNSYKGFLSAEDGILEVPNVENISASRLEALLNQAEKIGTNTNYYIYRTIGTSINNFWKENSPLAQVIYIMPSHVWGIYDSGEIWSTGFNAKEIVWLDGREGTEVYLNKNEILLERGMYEYLGLDKVENPTYEVRVETVGEDGTVTLKTIEANVVGLIERYEWTKDTDGTYKMSHISVYISQASLEEIGEVEQSTNYIVFQTDEPAALDSMITSMGLSANTMYKAKEIAVEEMRTHTETKAIIAMVLCVLLAINLYGSFANALQSRKFEVGVKRAIGASKWEIIRQFLWEGIIVMAGNIFLSIMIIMNGALIYKYVYQLIKGTVWTIYISAGSIAMFGVVTVSLTLIFSMVFAIQTTQVEIVQYLKAE